MLEAAGRTRAPGGQRRPLADRPRRRDRARRPGRAGALVVPAPLDAPHRALAAPHGSSRTSSATTSTGTARCAHYAAAKRAALDAQGTDDVAVLPADDADVRAAGYLEAGRGRRVLFGEGGAYALDGSRVRGPAGLCVDLTGFALWGAHNLRNALAAAAAALQVDGVGPEHVRAGALAARPLPHRLAPVGEVAGVLYVDDSNATNPTSTRCALEACPRPAVVLDRRQVQGARRRRRCSTLLAARARAVVGIGTTGPEVVRRLAGRRPGGGRRGRPWRRRSARRPRLARPGDAVLLSPAFSSLDQYPSFVVRGRAFQARRGRPWRRTGGTARAGASAPPGPGGSLRSTHDADAVPVLREEPGHHPLHRDQGRGEAGAPHLRGVREREGPRHAAGRSRRCSSSSCRAASASRATEDLKCPECGITFGEFRTQGALRLPARLRGLRRADGPAPREDPRRPAATRVACRGDAPRSTPPWPTTSCACAASSRTRCGPRTTRTRRACATRSRRSSDSMSGGASAGAEDSQ